MNDSLFTSIYIAIDYYDTLKMCKTSFRRPFVYTFFYFLLLLYFYNIFLFSFKMLNLIIKLTVWLLTFGRRWINLSKKKINNLHLVNKWRRIFRSKMALRKCKSGTILHFIAKNQIGRHQLNMFFKVKTYQILIPIHTRYEHVLPCLQLNIHPVKLNIAKVLHVKNFNKN